jgi:hypothetical protein
VCYFFSGKKGTNNQSFKTRPGSRPGFRVLAGSPGLTGSTRSILLKKNQNDVVLVKKKTQKSTGLSLGLDRVLPGQPGRRVTPGFSFPRFFINPARFRPRVGRVPGRPAGPDRISKLCEQPLKKIKENIG